MPRACKDKKTFLAKKAEDNKKSRAKKKAEREEAARLKQETEEREKREKELKQQQELLDKEAELQRLDDAIRQRRSRAARNDSKISKKKVPKKKTAATMSSSDNEHDSAQGTPRQATIKRKTTRGLTTAEKIQLHQAQAAYSELRLRSFASDEAHQAKNNQIMDDNLRRMFTAQMNGQRGRDRFDRDVREFQYDLGGLPAPPLYENEEFLAGNDESSASRRLFDREMMAGAETFEEIDPMPVPSPETKSSSDDNEPKFEMKSSSDDDERKPSAAAKASSSFRQPNLKPPPGTGQSLGPGSNQPSLKPPPGTGQSLGPGSNQPTFATAAPSAGSNGSSTNGSAGFSFGSASAGFSSNGNAFGNTSPKSMFGGVFAGGQAAANNDEFGFKAAGNSGAAPAPAPSTGSNSFSFHSAIPAPAPAAGSAPPALRSGQDGTWRETFGSPLMKGKPANLTGASPFANGSMTGGVTAVPGLTSSFGSGQGSNTPKRNFSEETKIVSKKRRKKEDMTARISNKKPCN